MDALRIRRLLAALAIAVAISPGPRSAAAVAQDAAGRKQMDLGQPQRELQVEPMQWPAVQPQEVKPLAEPVAEPEEEQ